MIKMIKNYFKTKKEYHAAMMKLSASVTGKIEQLLDAELIRTKTETETMEAVKQLNDMFSTEEMSEYMGSISQFLAELKQPSFQESFYQNIVEAAHQNSQET
ncbi:MAG: hypothetical protein HFI69_02670 [Lachnospiraceae bacterium]|jgi:predicted DNA-binding ArsR family transcriptional regulator|nr:hypothetical protein [Lachnospiraceae bacterium]